MKEPKRARMCMVRTWALAVHGVVAITAAGHIGALADRLAACRGAPSAVPVCSAVIMLLTLCAVHANATNAEQADS